MTRHLSSKELKRLRWLIGEDENKRVAGRLRDKDDDSDDWFLEVHNRRLKHKPIVSGDREKTITDLLKAWFATSRLSHFEYEGSAREALRLMFIRQGHSWQRADDEAWRLIQATFRDMGVVRPPREQGQQEWTLQEWCGFCRGPLDEAAIARRDRYCCPDCAKLALTKRSYAKGGYSADYFGQAAYLQIRRDQLPERTCQNPACQKTFRPNTKSLKDSENRQFCSTKCWYAVRRTLPDIQCQNPGCRKVFRPDSSGRKFCSVQCTREGRAVILPIRDCAYCQAPFQPKSEHALYCDPACNTKMKTRRKSEKRKIAREAKASSHPINKLFEDAA